MMTERNGVQLKLHSVTIEDLVPEDHLLRKVETLVDFTFIYEEVRSLYCENNGRNSTDPVMLAKYLLVGYLNGIESERRIEREIEVNMAYRWFLGLDIGERVPDHSTISQNRRRRFRGENLWRKIFERIVQQCIETGLVDGRVVVTDSTHVKANAGSRANIKVLVERETSGYLERLDRYEAEERTRLEEEGKLSPQRPGRKQSPAKQIEKTVSGTDPDAGPLNRPGKPKGMHYLSHQSVDVRRGIIVDVAVTPGNTRDSVPFVERMEYIQEKLGLDIRTAGADKAYGTSLNYRSLLDMGIQLCTPETEQSGLPYKVELKREDFRFDESKDIFVCPVGKELRLRSLEREEYNVCRVYRASPKDCRTCPMREKCVSNSQRSRTIRINIFEEAVTKQRETDGSPLHRMSLRLRQIWCEGTFAAQKFGHNLRRLFRRGLEAAEDHCLLSATALNLKRMVKCLG